MKWVKSKAIAKRAIQNGAIYTTWNETPFRCLVQAIVKQAADDYRQSLTSKTRKANAMRLDCEEFFTSEDFMMFTNISGETIMKMIQAVE